MSRSCRHTPIFGFTGAPSEKHDKQTWNRIVRVRWRSRDVAVSSRYLGYGAKDGKHWWKPVLQSQEYVVWFNRYMRK